MIALRSSRAPLLRWCAFTIAAVSCLAPRATRAALAAQDSSLHAERDVTYSIGKVIPLSAKVGPVRVESVEFTDRGRGSTGGLTSMLRPGASASETSTTIRSHFLAENPSTDEWQVTFTLEFLDKSGKLIDKAVKKSSWEGQAKPFDLDHPILQYVVPFIAQVRIKLEGRLD